MSTLDVGTTTLDAFLSAPLEDVRRISPQTMVLGAGGTRRRATLAGISASSAEYGYLTLHEMNACLKMIFAHGVEHVIVPLLLEGSYLETTPGYRDELVGWALHGLGGAEAFAGYAAQNWRVRLLGTESWPEMADLADQLVQNTELHSGPTVWFSVMSRPDLHWALVLNVVAQEQPATAAEAIQAIYGEPIPPATLYLGSGKPDVRPSAVPPLLIGDMHCYWRQQLGYDLDELTFRRVLYDYAYARRTWRQDKTGRADQALQYRSAWEAPRVIGLGFRLGPFWYPAPFELSPEISEEHERWTFGQSF